MEGGLDKVFSDLLSTATEKLGMQICLDPLDGYKVLSINIQLHGLSIDVTQALPSSAVAGQTGEPLPPASNYSATHLTIPFIGWRANAG